MSTLITRDWCVASKRSYNTGTYYASTQGTLRTDPDLDDAGIVQVRAGQLSYLRVRVVYSGDRGATSEVRLFKKSNDVWSPTDLHVAIVGDELNDEKTFPDVEHVIQLNAADALCWRIVAKSAIVGLFSLRYIAVRVEDQQA